VWIDFCSNRWIVEPGGGSGEEVVKLVEGSHEANRVGQWRRVSKTRALSREWEEPSIRQASEMMRGVLQVLVTLRQEGTRTGPGRKRSCSLGFKWDEA
jgi:hypothetical protein